MSLGESSRHRRLNPIKKCLLGYTKAGGVSMEGRPWQSESGIWVQNLGTEPQEEDKDHHQVNTW